VIVDFSDRQVDLKFKRQLFRDPEEVRQYEKIHKRLRFGVGCRGMRWQWNQSVHSDRHQHHNNHDDDNDDGTNNRHSGLFRRSRRHCQRCGRISFDAVNKTLTVTGLTQDGTSAANEYRHVADGFKVITSNAGTPADLTDDITYNAFVEGYTTFTQQNDALGRHSTAFVASRAGLQAGVVMTGGQFNKFFSGTFYERDGAFVAPSRFDVTYHGNYAAGINVAGPVTDLKPLTGTVDPDINPPQQSGYVRGLMFVNVDLNDMSVEGGIYNRTAVLDQISTPFNDDPGYLGLGNIVLVEGTLADDGSFAGKIENEGNTLTIGDFAGIIGGDAGQALAGGTRFETFTDAYENEIEYGVFVLDICEVGDTGTICTNSLPD